MSHRLMAGLVAFATVPAVPAILSAQCPDGTRPPCSRPAPASARAEAPDLNRIAVLPFRVTAADTLLGEGVAELLSAEFTGQGGPRAIHMGSVIRAWRAAGGGARVPLPQREAIQAARGLGAGYLVDGSIVGLGSRLTVNAAIVAVADGRVRQAAPLRGSVDSLDALLGRLSSTLLALAGAESRQGERGALTSSTPAMRAYLEGLTAWRRNRTDAAAAAFERAFAEDSLFAGAAFMRYRVATWRLEGAPTTRWARTIWALRERLSTQDRILLLAFLGERYPTPRLPAEVIADRERAVSLLPESPDAHYLLGDYLYHYGAAVNAADRLERARSMFERSLALDSQATVLLHLLDIAAFTADTAVIRRAWPTYERLVEDHWSMAWLLAGRLGDEAWLAALRRRVTGGERLDVLFQPSSLLLSAALFDEASEATARTATGPERAFVASLRHYMTMIQGRPAAAARAAADVEAGPRAGTALAFAMFGDGDSASGAAAAVWIAGQAPLPDSAIQASGACLLAHWRLRTGDTTVTWDEGLLERHNRSGCAATLRVVRAQRARAPDLAALVHEADSIVRRRLGPAVYAGFENLVLARAWESLGNLPRALAAIRLRSHAVGAVYTEATGAREEGRLAALAGDTAGAIRAYRFYLDLRKDAEPALHAQRDSVRAAVARLERRR